MRTDRLIEALAAELTPVGRRAPLRRFSGGLAGGVLAGALVVALRFGAPLPEAGAAGAAAFAMKIGFSLSVALLSAVLLFRSGQPGRRPERQLWWLGVPVLIVAAAALLELVLGPPAGWPGTTWRRCVATILTIAPLVLIGLAAGFRRLAPTRPRLTGLLAGTCSGGFAASLYALYCPERTAGFLFGSYALTIAAVGALCAILAPRFLRW